MKLTKAKLNSFEQTVKEIIRLSDTYYMDLDKFSHWTKEEFFEYIKYLKYVSDPDGIEFVNRPGISILLNGTGHPFDCDDRGTVSRAFFKMKKELAGEDYGTRIIVAGKKRRPHHVYIEYSENRADWLPYDPTYPHNQINQEPFIPMFKRVYY